LTTIRGAILAGGRASRFGGLPKGLEELGGARIVDRLAGLLAATLGMPPLLVANDPGAAAWGTGLRVVADLRPDTGTLGGLYTAVAEAPAPVVCVAWDMPFVTAGLVAALAEALAEADVAIPASGGPRGVEPLCAGYGAACAGPMADAIDRGDYRAIAFHPQVRVRRLELEKLPAAALPPAGVDPFFNVNTPEDLREARDLWPLFASSPSSAGRMPGRRP
jgi:molybdopterin-guanine dinucleotide biosynthesis protein A